MQQGRRVGTRRTASTGLDGVVDGSGPVFTSSDAPSVVETTTDVVTVSATDASGPVTFGITGGADQALFARGGTSGALSFTALTHLLDDDRRADPFDAVVDDLLAAPAAASAGDAGAA